MAGFDSLLWIQVRLKSGCHRTLKPARSEKCGPQTGLQCGATGSWRALLLQVQTLKSSRGSGQGFGFEAQGKGVAEKSNRAHLGGNDIKPVSSQLQPIFLTYAYPTIPLTQYMIKLQV